MEGISNERLMNVRAQLAAAAAGARRRRAMTSAVLLLLVAGLAGYYAWAYSQLAKVDAPTVVALVEQRFEPVLNQSPQEIARYMEAQAPQVVEQVVTLVKDAPATLASEGKGYIWAHTDQTIEEMEQEIEQTIVAMIQQATAEMRERNDGQPLTAQDMEKILNDMARQAGASIDAAIAQGKQRYDAESRDILAYLDHLAQGQNLSSVDRLHRQIITSFIALIEVWQAEKAGTPAAG